MASDIDLFNDALGQLGQTRITDLDQASTNNTVKLCLTFKDTFRRSILQDHNWNFATSWVVLAQEVATPVHKWTYQYTVPPNALRVWRIDEYEVYRWEIIRNAAGLKALATDHTPVTAEITFDVENVDQWSGMFYQAMAAGYAMKLAVPIMGVDAGLKVSRSKMEEFQFLLGEAKAVDAQEQNLHDQPPGDLILVRG